MTSSIFDQLSHGGPSGHFGGDFGVVYKWRSDGVIMGGFVSDSSAVSLVKMSECVYLWVRWPPPDQGWRDYFYFIVHARGVSLIPSPPPPQSTRSGSGSPPETSAESEPHPLRKRESLRGGCASPPLFKNLGVFW